MKPAEYRLSLPVFRITCQKHLIVGKRLWH